MNSYVIWPLGNAKLVNDTLFCGSATNKRFSEFLFHGFSKYQYANEGTNSSFLSGSALYIGEGKLYNFTPLTTNLCVYYDERHIKIGEVVTWEIDLLSLETARFSHQYGLVIDQADLKTDNVFTEQKPHKFYDLVFTAPPKQMSMAALSKRREEVERAKIVQRQYNTFMSIAAMPNAIELISMIAPELSTVSTETVAEKLGVTLEEAMLIMGRV